MDTIGGRIRGLRKRLDWSQADLAARVGVKQSYVSAIERGVRRPGALRLAKLAEVFGVASEWLETGEEPSQGAKPAIDEELRGMIEKLAACDAELQATVRTVLRGLLEKRKS